ncbi:MAG: phosphohydrolase [Pseudohongiella sp.]|nr:MAG: phosphohydrolase [Pseudohongiella sp.]
MNDEFRIKSLADLQEVISDPHPRIQKKVCTQLDDHSIDFIARSPLVCLGTSNAAGELDVSPKGDAPGFVRVLDAHTLVIPERPGNHLAMGFRNLLENDRIGVFFLIPGVKESFRVNGQATLSRDPELLEAASVNGKPAVLCTIVTVEECFFHCGKALIRSKLWQADSWPSNRQSNMVQQLSEVIGVEEKALKESIESSYENNLY